MGKKGSEGPVKNSLARLNNWVWTYPDDIDSAWKSSLQAVLRTIFIVLHEFRQDRIILRASALTFTVILSMVPMLALGTAVLKGLGVGDDMRNAAHVFVDQLELSEAISAKFPFKFKTPDEPEEKNQEPGSIKIDKQTERNLTGHLHRAVDEAFNYAERTNFAALGIFGILILLITVILMLDSIEKAMNAIWQSPYERSMGRKIMDYVALIILLPITINISFAAKAALYSPALLSKIEKIFPQALYLLSIVPLLIAFTVFTLLYSYLPNIKVRISRAAIGGILACIGWFSLQFAYINLQIGVAKYNAIYGSFATLPLFLLWIYGGWIVFLMGAEIAFAAQYWRTYVLDKGEISPARRLAAAFDIMNILFTDYQAKKISLLDDISGQVRLPSTHVLNILKALEGGGAARYIKGKEKGYVPAGPRDQIQTPDIADIILGVDYGETAGGETAKAILVQARKH